MYFKVRKIAVMLVVLAIFAFPVNVCAAEEEASWRDRLQGWYDSAKDKTGELVEAGKEKAPEVIDKAKDGIKDAQSAISDWNADQQDQFWDWVDGQVNGQGATSSDGQSTRAPVAVDPGAKSPQPTTPPIYGSDADIPAKDELTGMGADVPDEPARMAPDAPAKTEPSSPGRADPDAHSSVEDPESGSWAVSWLSGLGLIAGVALLIVVFLRILDTPYRAAVEERRREDERRKWQARH